MVLDELSLGILATVAGIMILSGWVPQIIKGYKTKKLDDVSKYLMIFIAGGAFFVDSIWYRKRGSIYHWSKCCCHCPYNDCIEYEISL